MASKPEVAAELLQALRIAVNKYRIARGGAKKDNNQNLDQLKTTMYEAHQALRTFLAQVLADIPDGNSTNDKLVQLKLVAKVLNWGSKEIFRYQALEMAVEEQQNEDSGKFVEDITGSPRSRLALPPKSKKRVASSPVPPNPEDDEEEVDGWEMLEAEDINAESWIGVHPDQVFWVPKRDNGNTHQQCCVI